LVNEVLDDPRYLRVEKLPETRSELCIPIKTGGRVIGVLDVQSDRPSAYGEADAALLRIVANYAGVAIDNARLFEETCVHAEEMTVLNELGSYDKSLVEKPRIVAANKMDLGDFDDKIEQLNQACDEPVFPISALQRTGLRELAFAAYGLRESAVDEGLSTEEPVKEYRFEPSFTIEKSGDTFVIVGEDLDRSARMTDFSNEEAADYFHSRLRQMGVYAALRRAGARVGDRVRIAEESGAWRMVGPAQGVSQGWMHVSALTRRKVVLHPGTADVEEAATSDELALAGKGFNKQVEEQFSSDNPDADYAWIDWMEARKISWCKWSVSDKNETCSVLVPRAKATGGWSPADLKPSGIHSRELLRKLNR